MMINPKTFSVLHVVNSFSSMSLRMSFGPHDLNLESNMIEELTTRNVKTDAFPVLGRQRELLPQRSVLFVCWANVCRSPAGESVLNRCVRKLNFQTELKIDSAGVDVEHNRIKPSKQMRWTAHKRGYRLKQRPRRVLRTDLIRFDLVIAMDRRVLSALRTIHSKPKSTIKLLGDFLSSNNPVDVPDPMNRSSTTCNLVFDMLESACPNIVETIRSS